MTYNIFSSGVNTSFSSQLNQNFNESLTIQGLNTIRSLIDRSGVWSKGNIDGWAEAYIDSNGRDNSVNTGTTTAEFSTAGTRYRPVTANGTTETLNVTTQSGTVSGSHSHNVTIIKDGYFSTIRAKSTGGGTAICTIYKGTEEVATTTTSISTSMTFSFTKANYKYFLKAGDIITITITAMGDISIKANQTYNGTNFSLSSASAFVDATDDEYSYIPLVYSSGEDIYHTIPSDTFSSTISKAIGVPLISEWESGANIQYKLTNDSEDTGWLNAYPPTISNFTAFTSEPTTLIVKIIPKSSSPTAGTPSIKGFFVRAN